MLCTIVEAEKQVVLRRRYTAYKPLSMCSAAGYEIATCLQKCHLGPTRRHKKIIGKKNKGRMTHARLGTT